MNIWIDTEFNGFHGELISMALVSEDNNEWYESLGCDNPRSWVATNVMPVIGVRPVTRKKIQAGLRKFLGQWESIHIIADWPEDIAHFCELLLTGEGISMRTPRLTFELKTDLRFDSAIPHNALEDARAFRLADLFAGRVAAGQ